MSYLRQGAWINAHSGQFSFIDEHANWAKCPGNLASIGLPESVCEAIADIPNDYGGPHRTKILLTVMAAGGIRMRGHGDVLVFEFTTDPTIVLPACRGVLREVAGSFTRCRFNNPNTSEKVEVFYREYLQHIQNGDFEWEKF